MVFVAKSGRRQSSRGRQSLNNFLQAWTTWTCRAAGQWMHGYQTLACRANLTNRVIIFDLNKKLPLELIASILQHMHLLKHNIVTYLEQCILFWNALLACFKILFNQKAAIKKEGYTIYVLLYFPFIFYLVIVLILHLCNIVAIIAIQCVVTRFGRYVLRSKQH